MTTENATFDIQKVKMALVRYSKVDMLGKSSHNASGFNDDAQLAIDYIAENNFGFASDIANTVKKFHYSISEKQAYWIAKAAVENNIPVLQKSVIFE